MSDFLVSGSSSTTPHLDESSQSHPLDRPLKKRRISPHVASPSVISREPDVRTVAPFPSRRSASPIPVPSSDAVALTAGASSSRSSQCLVAPLKRTRSGEPIRGESSSEGNAMSELLRQIRSTKALVDRTIEGRVESLNPASLSPMPQDLRVASVSVGVSPPRPSSPARSKPSPSRESVVSEARRSSLSKLQTEMETIEPNLQPVIPPPPNAVVEVGKPQQAEIPLSLGVVPAPIASSPPIVPAPVLTDSSPLVVPAEISTSSSFEKLQTTIVDAAEASPPIVAAPAVADSPPATAIDPPVAPVVTEEKTSDAPSEILSSTEPATDVAPVLLSPTLDEEIEEPIVGLEEIEGPVAESVQSPANPLLRRHRRKRKKKKKKFVVPVASSAAVPKKSASVVLRKKGVRRRKRFRPPTRRKKETSVRSYDNRLEYLEEELRSTRTQCQKLKNTLDSKKVRNSKYLSEGRDLTELTRKWREACSDVILELHKELKRARQLQMEGVNVSTMMVKFLRIDPKLIRFDEEEEEFRFGDPL